MDTPTILVTLAVGVIGSAGTYWGISLTNKTEREKLASTELALAITTMHATNEAKERAIEEIRQAQMEELIKRLQAALHIK